MKNLNVDLVTLKPSAEVMDLNKDMDWEYKCFTSQDATEHTVCSSF